MNNDSTNITNATNATGQTVSAPTPVAETPIQAVAPAPVSTEVPAQAQAPVPAVAQAPVPAVAQAPVPAVAQAPVPAVAEAPVPAVAQAPVPAVAQAPVPAVAQAPVPAVAQAPVPAVAQAPVPAVAEAPVPAVAQAPVTQAPVAEQVPMAAQAPVAQAPLPGQVPMAAQAPVAEVPVAGQVPMAAQAPLAQAPVAEQVPMAAQAPVAQAPLPGQVPMAAQAPLPGQLPLNQMPANGNSMPSYDEYEKPKKSGSKVFIILLLLIAGGVGYYFYSNNGKDGSGSKKVEGTLLENAEISGYMCGGSSCTISVGDYNNSVEYEIKTDRDNLLLELNDYSDDITVNLYYTEDGGKRTVVDFDVILKSSGEKLEDIKTENDLREKLGLPTAGMHTEELTYTGEDDYPGFGSDDNGEYLIYTYYFTDKDNNTLEMDYETSGARLDLVSGNKYTVTYEAVKGSFEFSYKIKEVK